MKLSKLYDPFGIFGIFKTPKQPAMKPETFKRPATADEGTFIPILWGTRPIKSQCFGYFGDVKQVAIKSKQGKKG